MLSSTELRPGMTIRLEGDVHKVVEASYHAGGGKMGGVTHAKLRSLKTGTVRERRFRPDEAVETVEIEHQAMQFLYSDGDGCHFMSPESYEQIELPSVLLGRAAAFLSEGMQISVELFEGRPIGVHFPDVIEARVAETAPAFHAQGTDNVWKEARLENGARVMVPPFIGVGETIRVDVESARYVERAKAERKR
jgi:elongation factor P